MKDRNSKTELTLWTLQALITSNVPIDEHKKLKNIAFKVIKEGGLRGDISDKWIEMGYGIEDISDLYI